MQKRFFTIFLLAIFGTWSSLASATECKILLNKLEINLNDVPAIKEYIKVLLTEAPLPPNIHRALERGLEKNPNIVDLTEEVRRAVNLPQNSGALAWMTNHVVRKGIASSLTLNDQVSNVTNMNASIIDQSRDNILVPNISNRNDALYDFALLMHELAHIRLALMLDRVAPILLQRLPSHIISFRDGVYLIDSQFLDFIHERYAFSIQIHTYMSLSFRKYLKDGVGSLIYNYTGFNGKPYVKVVKRETLDQDVEEIVINTYGISAETTRRWGGLSISDILRGKMNP